MDTKHYRLISSGSIDVGTGDWCRGESTGEYVANGRRLNNSDTDTLLTVWLTLNMILSSLVLVHSCTPGRKISNAKNSVYTGLGKVLHLNMLRLWHHDVLLVYVKHSQPFSGYGRHVSRLLTVNERVFFSLHTSFLFLKTATYINFSNSKQSTSHRRVHNVLVSITRTYACSYAVGIATSVVCNLRQ